MTTSVNDFPGEDAFSTQATIPGQGARRGRNRARRAPRTWAGRKHQGTPRIHRTAYDVSPADARCESLGGAQTKGDDAMRGKNSPHSFQLSVFSYQPVKKTLCRRAFFGCRLKAVSWATFRLPLEREEKETMPSLPGDRQRPDPVELFGAASVFLPISGTPDHEPSRRRRRRLPDVRKKPIARMVANTT